uniref:hypothetical protein n=1 Tax=Metallibacterium scheffleri TaxID=993689 RepID=UPI0023F1A536
MTKRTTTNRPEIGRSYRVEGYCGTCYTVTVIAIDARFVHALDDDKHPLRWTRAGWRRAMPAQIS